MTILEILLKNLEHCEKKSKAHAMRAAWLNWWNHFLGITSTILTAIVGSSVYKGFEQAGTAEQAANGDGNAQIVTAIIALSATIISGVKAVVEPGSEVKPHWLAKKKYGHAIHKIKTTIAIYTEDRQNFKFAMLSEIDDEIREASEIGPVIPDSTWKTVKKEHEKNKKNKQRELSQVDLKGLL